MVVVDQSMALIMAVVKTFTQYSTLSMYLNVCWNLLANVRNRPDVPTCFIRLDFNHIMHSVASWPPLRSKQRRVKSFYLYAIGLLITCTSLEDAKYLFKQIFYVSHHEEDGMNDASEPTACEIAKRYLKERIATHNNDINMEEEGDCSNINEPDIQDGNELFEDHYQITSPCTVFDEVKKIYEERPEKCWRSRQYAMGSSHSRKVTGIFETAAFVVSCDDPYLWLRLVDGIICPC